MHPSAKRWLRRIGMAVAVLVVLVGAGLWWLLGRNSGLHFVLDHVTGASNGTIAIQAADGTLAGPLQLTGVTYRDADGGIAARIDHLEADIAVWSLLYGQVRLTTLEAQGIKVDLTTPTRPQPESDTAFSLQPPLDVRLDHVHIADVRMVQDGKPAFAADSLDLAGAWTRHGLSIDELKLRAPKGRADLSGTLELAAHKRGKGHGSFRWTVDDTTWAGTLKAQSDGSKAHLALALSQPMDATLQLDMQQSDQYPSAAKLSAPTFDAKPILGDSSIRTLALALAGHGDRTGGTLTGQVDLNQTRFRLEPLELHYHRDTQKVELDRLVLVSPDIQGQLKGHGNIDLAAQPVSADLALAWRDVVVP